ncbi:MAG TPA: hypothetical protein VFG24_09415 [Nitrosopumilaceae archaeon]|nr:hypothetical protein [Nitrosopumilaceae archaeon]
MKDLGESTIPQTNDEAWNTIAKNSYGCIYEKKDGSCIVTGYYDSKGNSMKYKVHFNPNFIEKRSASKNKSL